MRLTRGAALLLVLGALVLGALLILPLANVVAESFRLYLPGRIGTATDAPYTLINYQEPMLPAYVGYFADTFRLGFIVSVVEEIAIVGSADSCPCWPIAISGSAGSTGARGNPSRPRCT